MEKITRHILFFLVYLAIIFTLPIIIFFAGDCIMGYFYIIAPVGNIACSPWYYSGLLDLGKILLVIFVLAFPCMGVIVTLLKSEKWIKISIISVFSTCIAGLILMLINSLLGTTTLSPVTYALTPLSIFHMVSEYRNSRGIQSIVKPPQHPQKSAPQSMQKEQYYESLEKLKKLIRVSKRLEISQIAGYLGLTQNETFARLVEWANQYHFSIDKQEIVFETTQKEDFILELERKFEEWNKPSPKS